MFICRHLTVFFLAVLFWLQAVFTCVWVVICVFVNGVSVCVSCIWCVCVCSRSKTHFEQLLPQYNSKNRIHDKKHVGPSNEPNSVFILSYHFDTLQWLSSMIVIDSSPRDWQHNTHTHTHTHTSWQTLSSVPLPEGDWGCVWAQHSAHGQSSTKGWKSDENHACKT